MAVLVEENQISKIKKQNDNVKIKDGEELVPQAQAVQGTLAQNRIRGKIRSTKHEIRNKFKMGKWQNTKQHFRNREKGIQKSGEFVCTHRPAEYNICGLFLEWE